LQVAAFHWFNRHLKGSEPIIDQAAVPLLKPEDLKVFDKLPADQIVTKIQESFVQLASPPAPPAKFNDWPPQRDQWKKELKEMVFHGWPAEPGPLNVQSVVSATRGGLQFDAYEFTSQPNVRLRFYTLSRAGLAKPATIELRVHDDRQWSDLLAALAAGFSKELSDEFLPAANEAAFQSLRKSVSGDAVLVFIAPRGVGRTQWNLNVKAQTQQRRRFVLIGQTLEGMQVFDVRRAIQSLDQISRLKNPTLVVSGTRQSGLIGLFAAIFEPRAASIELVQPPTTFRDGPFLLNIDRVLSVPEAVAIAAENCPVRFAGVNQADWSYPRAVARTLHLTSDRLTFAGAEGAGPDERGERAPPRQ
ncbi:MAG TPA: hypothetical protein VFE24_04140, partial [Pirellulales bacterium]|nr:hypothetical protein [Pirellulales bacterium]